MKRVTAVLCLFAGCMMMFPAMIARAQDAAAQCDQLDADLALARTDLRAKKAAIIREQLELTKSEEASFAPVYKRYETELVALNDSRWALIKDYAAAYNSDTVTDARAKAWTDQALELEERKHNLRSKRTK